MDITRGGLETEEASRVDGVRLLVGFHPKSHEEPSKSFQWERG